MASKSRYHRRIAEPFDHGEPITRMSIVPMVVVFACLCMFILIRIPNPTHALTIALPVVEPADMTGFDVQVDLLEIGPDGGLLWNQQRVSPDELVKRLRKAVSGSSPRSSVFEPHGDASYGDIAQALGIVWPTATSGRYYRFCFRGLDEHKDFDGYPALSFSSHRMPGSTAPRRDDYVACDPTGSRVQPSIITSSNPAAN